MGSHMVGLTPLLFSHTTPFGPTLLRPIPVGGLVAGLSPCSGIGPRELPSQWSQPTAQPFENPAQGQPISPRRAPRASDKRNCAKIVIRTKAGLPVLPTGLAVCRTRHWAQSSLRFHVREYFWHWSAPRSEVSIDSLTGRGMNHCSMAVHRARGGNKQHSSGGDLHHAVAWGPRLHAPRSVARGRSIRAPAGPWVLRQSTRLL